jgi:molybdate transport system regulatory protein
MRTQHTAAVSVRLRFADDARLGPGKIALLEAVERSGSIAAAGRDMNMSYRRAWLLIDSLNRMFDEPVVHASPGGANGGGAELSGLGRSLVAAYRAMEAETEAAIERHFAPLRARMTQADASESETGSAAASRSSTGGRTHPAERDERDE